MSLSSENRLAKETSLYLLQHKDDPVDWRPWQPEVFEEAKRQNKPVFLSVGYSSCHWCHVMAQECFSNSEIADRMNELFINVKVDREERPDVDAVYMKALIALLGQGGWPLSLFLTPSEELYFGGTYFPPRSRNNQLGFFEILEHAHSLYQDPQGSLKVRVDNLMKKLEASECFSLGSSVEMDPKIIEKAAELLFGRFDEINGGFGTGMKFPEPMLYCLLLRHWRRFASQRSMEVIDKSLTQMVQGGVYDQLGGGFHRYATDREWRIPHFEKMLCDNALLAKLFLEMFQATKQDMYEETPREIFSYIQLEMTSPEGWFYSSQDSDSDGQEGLYYVWELREILDLLGPRHSKLFASVFGMTARGNVGNGKNILYLNHSLEKVSEDEGVPIFEVDHIIKNGKKKLFQARRGRSRPGRDEKMIVAWNSMMISALANGSSVLGDACFLETAGRCADFIWSHARIDGILHRIYKNEAAWIPGFLDDHAWYLDAQLALYEASLDSKWIQRGLILADEMIDGFWDEKEGGFFISGKCHDQLISQIKNPQDEAQPSANAIAAIALLKLGNLTGRKRYLEKGEKVLRAFQGILVDQPASATGLLAALDYFLEQPSEIVFTGSSEEPEFKKMLRIVHKDFRPNKVLLYAPDQESETLFPIAKGKKAQDGKPTIYLCQKGTCYPPVQSAKAFENQLEPPPVIKVNIFDEEKNQKELELKQTQDFLGAMSQIFKHSGLDRR